MNVQSQERDEICDGINVQAGGQNLELEGPEVGGAISVIVLAEDSESGVREVTIQVTSNSVTCSTDDGDTAVTRDGLFAPTTDRDSTPRSPGDEVPVGRSIFTTSDVRGCGDQEMLGYAYSFTASAENYIGGITTSQEITIGP